MASSTQSVNKDRDLAGAEILTFTLVLSGLLAIYLVALWFNRIELLPDEAQYWSWSNHLDWGYFSKPPLLAWLIAAVTGVCGSDSLFCVRLLSPLLTAGTAIWVFALAAYLYDTRTALWAGILFFTLPGIAYGVNLVGTDFPLMFFWAGALYAFVRLERQGGWGWAMLLGAMLGAGMMSKYAMAFWLPCWLAYVLLMGRQSPFARWRELLLALAIAALVFAPNIAWNIGNGWITFIHVDDTTGWAGWVLYPGRLRDFLLWQIGVFGPVLAGVYLIILGRRIFGGADWRARFLIAFSLPILVIVSGQALIYHANPNWAALTYIAASILVAHSLVHRLPAFWRWAGLAINGGVTVAHAVILVLMAYGLFQWPAVADPYLRHEGPEAIAAYAGQELASGDYAAVLTDGKSLSATMRYYLRHRPEVQRAWKSDELPDDHFELAFGFQDDPATPALLISRQEDIGDIAPHFDSVERIGMRRVSERRNIPIWLYRLDGYTGR